MIIPASPTENNVSPSGISHAPDGGTVAISEIEIEPDSRLATREARIARRESQVWLRRPLEMVRSLFPLCALAFTMTGALTTFFRHETDRSFATDVTITLCFVLVLAIVAYLNPQVQQYVQTRGRARE